MIKKHLEKSVVLNLGRESEKPESTFKLEYYLLESQCFGDGEKESRNIYGVEIVKRCQEEPTEVKQYINIYSTIDKARSLINLLAKNTVTPISLPYILDDMLAL